LNPRGICPKDPYSQSRDLPQRTYKTPSEFDKLKQFMELDRKVLRFYCIWDDRDSMFGEIRPCVSDTFNPTQWALLQTAFSAILLTGHISTL